MLLGLQHYDDPDFDYGAEGQSVTYDTFRDACYKAENDAANAELDAASEDETEEPIPEGPSGASEVAIWESQHDTNEEAREEAERPGKAKKASDDLSDGMSDFEGQAGAHVGSLNDFDAYAEDIKNQMDSLSDLSTTEQMRLQMMVDRRAKLLEGLSNIMKKMQQTMDVLVSAQKS